MRLPPPREDHACFVKAVGGEQHIGNATVADYQNIIDMKRDLMKGSNVRIRSRGGSPELKQRDAGRFAASPFPG
jgi:hypothetical protein